MAAGDESRRIRLAAGWDALQETTGPVRLATSCVRDTGCVPDACRRGRDSYHKPNSGGEPNRCEDLLPQPLGSFWQQIHNEHACGLFWTMVGHRPVN